MNLLLLRDNDPLLSGQVDAVVCNHNGSEPPWIPNRTHSQANSQNVIGRVTVERLLEQLLVKVVTNETGRTSENEKTVETKSASQKDISDTTPSDKSNVSTHAPLFK